MDEHGWLDLLRSGDSGALEHFLEQYSGMMAYIVRGILQDPHEAEECLAQVRAKLWEKLPTYQGERASLSTWITAVCRNAAYDRLRERQRHASRRTVLEENHPDPAPGPEEQVLLQERTRQLRQALEQLKEADRRLFYRKYYYLQSTAQIATELGMTPRAVEGRLYRIRRKLQDKLGGDGQ